MEAWFCKNLGDAMLAGERLGEIERRFRSIHTDSGSPGEMGLFMRHESEGRLHCEVVLYFTPAAHAVAHEAGTRRCPRPSREGLCLVAGSEDAWSLLPPGQCR